MDFVCYFNDAHEYPDISSIPLLVDNIGDGMLFEYVSNTFLLAYINHVEIIKGMVFIDMNTQMILRWKFWKLKKIQSYGNIMMIY